MIDRLKHRVRPLALVVAALAMVVTGTAGASKVRNRDMGSFQRPIANSAWAALGFQQRPLKEGDAWRYAWSFRKKLSIHKRAIHPYERANPKWGPPVIIDYRVNKVTTQTVGGQKRRVAMITAIYASSVRDSLQTGNELWVDQYFNPVQRCVYTKWMLHGRCRDRDTTGVIHSMGAKPLFIGDIEKIPAQWATTFSTPVAPTLKSYASKLPRTRYLAVPVQGGNIHFADTYWAPGNLVPSFVTGRDIQGVLIGQRKVR
jgi:hypothetical protein